MKKFFITIALLVRWAWFHISPRYIKFRFSPDSEGYFKDMKTGAILCDYRWKKSPDTT